MIRYFDYITMADYSKDTAELAEQAAFIIAKQSKEIKQLKTLIGALVNSAGKISISRDCLNNDFMITRFDDPATNSLIYTNTGAKT